MPSLTLVGASPPPSARLFLCDGSMVGCFPLFCRRGGEGREDSANGRTGSLLGTEVKSTRGIEGAVMVIFFLGAAQGRWASATLDGIEHA